MDTGVTEPVRPLGSGVLAGYMLSRWIMNVHEPLTDISLLDGNELIRLDKFFPDLLPAKSLSDASGKGQN